MSASPESSLVNGYASPEIDSSINANQNGNVSESDLSDDEAAEAGNRSSGPAMGAEPSARPDSAVDQSSDSSHDEHPDEGEFNMADSPVSARSVPRHIERASSSESRSAGKRKADHFNEDEFMRENPTLYGLRRSVCISVNLFDASAHTKQGRATQRRKIVSLVFPSTVFGTSHLPSMQVDSDDDDVSDSDVAPQSKRVPKRPKVERSLPGMLNAISTSWAFGK